MESGARISVVDCSFVGPAIDDAEILARFPAEIVSAFELHNGFVALDGGLHVRGACLGPDWHSLRVAWEGQLALHSLYPAVLESDIPIAEDCFGDQYLIRDGAVVHLSAETGDVEKLDMNWPEFLRHADEDPVEFLMLSQLVRFLGDGGKINPGQLLSVYPPFIAKECVNPSLRAIPALERRSFLADFAKQIRDLPNGAKIQSVTR